MNKSIIAVCQNEESRNALISVCKEMNIDVKAEVQSNEEIKYEVKDEEIKNATYILFVIDYEVEEIEKIERFIDCEYYEVEPKYVMNDVKAVLNEILSEVN